MKSWTRGILECKRRKEKKTLAGLPNKMGVGEDDPERTTLAPERVLLRSFWETRKVHGKEQGHGQMLSKRQAKNNSKLGFSV